MGDRGAVAPGMTAAQSPTYAGYDLLLVCHGVCALGGLAAVMVTGIQSYRVLRLPAGGDLPASLRRYFMPGVNWVARILYGVPVFGFALLGASRGAYGLDDVWVMIGLSIWVVVIGLGEGLLWPTERRVQGALERGRGDLDAARSACRSACVVSLVMSVLLVGAFVVMFTRP